MAEKMVNVKMSLKTWELIKSVVDGGVKTVLFSREKQNALKQAWAQLAPSEPFDE